MYSSLEDLSTLGRYKTFGHQSGLVVDRVKNHGDIWVVEGRRISDGRAMKPVTGRQIILAAGTLGTTRIVLSSLNYNDPVQLLSCPTAAFLIWLPQLFGVPYTSTVALGQLSYSLTLSDDVVAFGSTFATTGIPMFEFAFHVPLRRRYGIDVLSTLLSSCAVGNLFLPGHLTAAEAQLGRDGYLSVSGSYRDGVTSLMDDAAKRLRRAYRQLGAVLVPTSFKIGIPGSDVHYAGTLPMRRSPVLAETSPYGEVAGLPGVFVVDGACLPVLPEKSHTLTIMANADRIGRYIARQVAPGT